VATVLPKALLPGTAQKRLAPARAKKKGKTTRNGGLNAYKRN
jgi:hypothetical protein